MGQSSDRIVLARTAPMALVEETATAIRQEYPNAELVLLTQEGTLEEAEERISPAHVVPIPAGFFKLRKISAKAWKKLRHLGCARAVLVDAGTSGGTFTSWIMLFFSLGISDISIFRGSDAAFHRIRRLESFRAFLKRTWKSAQAVAGLLFLLLISLPGGLVLRFWRSLTHSDSPVKKVLFVSHEGQINGAPKSLLDLACALDRTYYQPLIVSPEEGLLTQKARDAGLETHILPVSQVLRQKFTGRLFLDDILTFLGGVYGLLKLILKERIDIVHVNTIVTPDGMVAAALAGTARVWHFRDFLFRDSSWRQVQLFFLGLFAQKVIAISRYMEEEALNTCSREQVSLIMNGLDLKEFDPETTEPASRTRLGVPDNAFVCAVVGQITPVKGTDHVVKAMRLVLESDKNSHLMIVGKREYKAYIAEMQHQIERWQLRDYIHFIGYRSDIPAVLLSCDAVVIPSMWEEPFGRLAIEAMGMGRPVVAYASGGLRETIHHGQNGLLVSRGDIRALADALLHLKNNPLEAKIMAARGRELAVDFYNSKRVAADVTAVYNRLMGTDFRKRN